MKRVRKNTKGFTLVELVIVIAILGILLAIAVPSLASYIQKQKEKDAIADCKIAVSSAQALYKDTYARNDREPITSVSYERIRENAGVDGIITDCQVNSDLIVQHLIYVLEPYQVVYCAHAGKDGHTDTYTITEISGDISGGEDGETEDDEDDSGGDDNEQEDSDSEGESGETVTVTDSSGIQHILSANSSWEELYHNINYSWGDNAVGGSIYCENGELYLVVTWNLGLDHENNSNLSLSELAEKHPQDLYKLTPNTKIYIEADKITNQYGSTIWDPKDLPQKGDLCFYNGKYYVAPGNGIGSWTFPPGGWAEIKQ